MIANRYEKLELLGGGGFSHVYKVLDTQNGKIYALKEILHVDATQLIDDEIATLKKLNESGESLKYYGVVRDAKRLFLKLEFASGQNLKEMVEEGGVFDEKMAFKLLRDITTQLLFAHENKIIHNDIKPQNIIYHNEKFHLVDWGISLKGEQKHYDRVLTDEMFLTPEHYNAEVFFKSDLFALGHVAYYALHGHLLYRIFSMMSNVQVMLFHFTKEVEYKKSLSKKMQRVLENMLCKDVAKRVSTLELYNNLLNDTLCSKVESEKITLPPKALDTNKKIIKFLAKHKILHAEFLYAVMLEDSKKYKEAIEIYLSLADKKFSRAMNNLGYLYEANNGVKRNYKISSHWYYKAGQLSNAMAIYNMSKVYRYGKGVEKNVVKADALFNLAIKKGYIDNIHKDEVSDDLVKWIRENGGYIHSSLYVNSQKINGNIYRSIYSKGNSKILESDKLTRIPHKLTISQDVFNKIPNIESWSLAFGNRENFKLIVALMYEMSRGEKSFYYPYLRSLPRFDSFKNHPIYVYYKNNDAFKALESLRVEFTNIMVSKYKELVGLVELVFSCNKKRQLFDLSHKKLEELIVWAYFSRGTRSWFERLIPFNEIFNHHQKSNMFLKTLELNETTFGFNADSQFSNNVSEPFELFIHYGHYDLITFLAHYNFVPNSEVNFLEFPFRLKSKDKFEKLKIQEIQNCKIKPRVVLLSNRGPSSKLLAIVRILSFTQNEYELYSKEESKNIYEMKLNNENELRARGLLKKIILELKELNYSAEIMKKNSLLLSSLENKKVLTTAETIVKNVCKVKVKEYEVIEGSLSWVRVD